MHTREEIDKSLMVFKKALLEEQAGLMNVITIIESGREHNVNIDGATLLALNLLSYDSLLTYSYIVLDSPEEKLLEEIRPREIILNTKEWLAKKESDIKVWKKEFEKIENAKEKISKKYNEILLQRSASDDTLKFYIHLSEIFEILHLFYKRKIRLLQNPPPKIDLKKVN